MTNDAAAAGLENAEDVIPYWIAERVVKLIYGSALPDGKGTGDPDLTIDGIIMGLAIVMEQAPEFTTPSRLRKGCDDFGKRLHMHAKTFRTLYEKTGKHVIEEVMRDEGADARAPVRH